MDTTFSQHVQTLVRLKNANALGVVGFCVLLHEAHRINQLTRAEADKLCADADTNPDLYGGWAHQYLLRYTQEDGGLHFYAISKDDNGRILLPTTLRELLAKKAALAASLMCDIEDVYGTEAISDAIGHSYSHLIELVQAVASAVNPKFL